PFSRFAANKITRIMKWGISPSREMPHFFVYFSTRTVMVCLQYFNKVEISSKRNNLTAEDFRNEAV
ncbi:hypothetical protein PO185_01130, partial [Limosilactobacillus mucosae]|nr:hypothetical protein [Limosilactobacillus mucosae]